MEEQKTEHANQIGILVEQIEARKVPYHYGREFCNRYNTLLHLICRILTPQTQMPRSHVSKSTCPQIPNVPLEQPDASLEEIPGLNFRRQIGLTYSFLLVYTS